MKQELKIRIEDRKQIEKKLQEKKAQVIKETHFTDTYFTVATGNVLKIVEDEKGARLVHFVKNKGKFDVVGRDSIDDLEKTLDQLIGTYGMSRVLTGIRREYTYENLDITFNLIDDLGEFLIVTGEEGQENFIKNVLQIEHPEYITVPFSEL